MALLVALSTAWATGQIGLSLTLGAFLGGMAVAETPYRAIIQSEVKPFRGLLLGFFISVGLSLDVGPLLHLWPVVIGISIRPHCHKSSEQRCCKFSLPVVGARILAARISARARVRVCFCGAKLLPAVRTMIGPVRVSIVVQPWPSASPSLPMWLRLAGEWQGSCGVAEKNSMTRARAQGARGASLNHRHGPDWPNACGWS